MTHDKVLLFLPDISGFTDFVERTDIDHGQHIISELIELLIAENTLGLTVAEVEGDAVFFYSRNGIPSLELLLDQCRRMFIRFHSHIAYYDKARICDCGACSTTANLSLKFVAHAGPIRELTVNGHAKPFGIDVIMAHRLLKNEVPSTQYLLLTDALMGEELPMALSSLRQFPPFTARYDDLPPIGYRAFDLGVFRSEVVPSLSALPPLGRSATPIRHSVQLAEAPASVYARLIDLDTRIRWDSFAKRIDRPDRFVNRRGSTHTCVLPMGSMHIETIAGGREDEGYHYEERLRDVPFIRDAYIQYHIGPVAGGSLLTTETHLLPTSWTGRTFLPLIRKRLSRWVEGSLERFATNAKREPALAKGCLEEPRTDGARRSHPPRRGAPKSGYWNEVSN